MGTGKQYRSTGDCETTPKSSDDHERVPGGSEGLSKSLDGPSLAVADPREGTRAVLKREKGSQGTPVGEAHSKQEPSQRTGGGGAMLKLLLAAGTLRAVMIVFGEWQDAHLEVKYTDVDYLVFSDAAHFASNGQSPYLRYTYRYSPLLAYALLPNVWVHPVMGKVLFSVADVLTGRLIYSILRLRGVSPYVCAWCMAAWLFNPFTFTIATRGNCEALVTAMLLAMLHCLARKRVTEAAVWYGLVVHLRIYPIIFSLPILLLLNNEFPRTQIPGRAVAQSPSSPSPCLRFPASFINRERLLFAAVSGVLFLALTGVFYLVYGYDFLFEAFLYHVTRTDPRHNFSIYFYHLYLQDGSSMGVISRLSSFLPQAAVLLTIAVCFASDLPFCMFLQTVVFVAFNKVCTAQYFVWFFCLLPLILPFTGLRLRGRGGACIVVWVAAQLHWLAWAYQLEFEGLQVFLPLWVASLVFFAANVWTLRQIITHHRFTLLFGQITPHPAPKLGSKCKLG